MKTLLYGALALLLCACGSDAGSAKPPSLQDSRGQWLVINYWAQWCKPCIKEIPELNRLAQDYPQISVLGVNYDGARGEELQQQIKKLGIAFANLDIDPAPELGLPRPMVLPTTLIVTPQGEHSATLVGPQTTESLLHATQQISNASAP